VVDGKAREKGGRSQKFSTRQAQRATCAGQSQEAEEGDIFIDDLAALDLELVQRAGTLTDGLRLEALVTGAHDRFRVTVTVVAELAFIKHWRAGAAEPPYGEWIGLSFSTCRYGGRRPWLTCPNRTGEIRCGKRATKLYLIAGGLRCRSCVGRPYRCQNLRPVDRAIARVRKERGKVGGDPNLGVPFPERPLGMRRATYERIQARAQLAEARAHEASWAKLDRLLTRSNCLK
jgi:hypothetical protein